MSGERETLSLLFPHLTSRNEEAIENYSFSLFSPFHSLSGLLHYPNGQVPTAGSAAAAVAAAAATAAASASALRSGGASVMDPQQQSGVDPQSHHTVTQSSHSPTRSISSPVTPSSSNLTFQVSRTMMSMDQGFTYPYITNGHTGHAEAHHPHSQSHDSDV